MKRGRVSRPTPWKNKTEDNMIIKKYKTWFDRRTRGLVTYDNRWTKEDWRNLMVFDELQSNQNPFELDEVGVYRVLYGKKVYHAKYYEGMMLRA